MNPVAATVYHPPPDDGAPLVYLDHDLAIAVKPSGLLSAPGRGADKADCLIARLHRLHPELLLVHRLDMDTSGLMAEAGANRTILESDRNVTRLDGIPPRR